MRARVYRRHPSSADFCRRVGFIGTGRTPGVFNADLRKMLSTLREQVGDECIVILPAMPMEQVRVTGHL